MKFITGFFMAWGNFLSLPCPVKKWDHDLKNYMLAFLPSVGLIIGLIWAGVCLLLAWLTFPFLVIAFLMTFLPFALCGFLHLDGFMDCSDALLSRKPQEQKQQILKDSHVGAFSVISLVFLLLGFHAFLSTAISNGLDLVNLCLIPIVSRSVSGLHVLCCRPLKQSQYASGAGAFNKIQKRNGCLVILLQLFLFGGIGFYYAFSPAATALIIAVEAIAGALAVFAARRQLGGMNGDIAGWSIVWSELAGVFALTLI